MFAQTIGVINCRTTASLGKFALNKNSFAVRCAYSIEMKAATGASLQIIHDGPIEVYNDGQLVTESESSKVETKTIRKTKLFAVGFH